MTRIALITAAVAFVAMLAPPMAAQCPSGNAQRQKDCVWDFRTPSERISRATLADAAERKEDREKRLEILEERFGQKPGDTNIGELDLFLSLSPGGVTNLNNLSIIDTEGSTVEVDQEAPNSNQDGTIAASKSGDVLVTNDDGKTPCPKHGCSIVDVKD